MRFDALQVIDQMEKELGKFGITELLIRKGEEDWYTFRLTLYTSSSIEGRHNVEFNVRKQMLDDPLAADALNALYIESYHKLKRLANFGF